jgi:AraC-like DNA-binding protein
MRQPMLTSRQDAPPGPPARGTVSAEYLRMLAYAAEARGLAPAEIFSSEGIDPTILDRRGARVAMEPVSRAWDQIVRRLQDPLFGLQLVETLPFGAGDILDYLVRSSGTAGEAMRLLIRYAPLMSDADHLALNVSGREARVMFRTAGDVPHTCEMIVGLFARRSRELFGSSWSLMHVSFAHESLGPTAAYDRAFQAPVFFGMPFNEAVFRRDLIDVPMIGADPRLNAILKAQAEGFLSALGPPPSPPTFMETVEQALMNGLSEGDVTLTRLADHLGLNTRTVQRRLRDMGATHRGVVRKLRLDIAARSLAGPQASQRQIARALGYSGTGAFHRAFKSWSGMTPGEVRARGAGKRTRPRKR